MDRGPTIVTYLVLLLFGIAQGVVGAFFYGSGPAPVASVGFDLAIGATCLLGAWGTRSGIGAVGPAAGWLATTFVLASVTGGSVLIAASTAGEWFLFGGAISAMAGLVIGFFVWSRPDSAAPGGRFPR